LFLTFSSKIIVFWSVTPRTPGRSVDVQTGVWQTIAGEVVQTGNSNGPKYSL